MYHYYTLSRPLPITFFLSRPNHVIRSDFVSHPAGFPKQCQPLSMTWLEAHGWLTLWQRDGDDDAVSGSYPQAVAGDHQSGDPHEREAQLTGACDTHSISRLNGTAGLSNALINTALTQHLADVRLDVNILQVLVCVRVEEPEGRVQTNGHPDTVAIPRQLPHLTLLTRMSVERFLCVRNSRPISSPFITCKGDSWAGISMSFNENTRLSNYLTNKNN